MRNSTPSHSRRPGRGRSNSTDRRGRPTSASHRSNTGSSSELRKQVRDARDKRDPSRPPVGSGEFQANQAPRAEAQYSRPQRPQAVPREEPAADTGNAAGTGGAGGAASAKNTAGTPRTAGSRAARHASSRSRNSAQQGPGGGRKPRGVQWFRKSAGNGANGAKGSRDSKGSKGSKNAKGAGRTAKTGATVTGAPGGNFTTRLRKFLPTVAIAHGAAVAVVVALAFVVLLSLDVTFVAAPATIASFWLALNLAPLQMSGATLGILPLLPAALYVAWVALRIRTVVRERVSVSDVRMLVGCGLFVPLLLTLTALAMLWDAQPVLPVEVPNVWMALAKTLGVNAFALLIGLGPKLWKALFRFRGLPEWPVDAVRLALQFLSAMWGVGAVVVIVSMIAHASAVGDAYAIAQGAGEKFGLTILWLLYLPTVAAGGGAVLAGSEAHIGPASVSLFSATQAELPPLPVLAAVPSTVSSAAWVGLLIPAAVAILVYRRFTSSRDAIVSPYATVGIAGIAAALLGIFFSWLTGGELGVYGWCGMLWSLTGIVCLGWMIGVGVITMAVIGIQDRRSSRVDAAATSPDEQSDIDVDAEDAEAEGAGQDEPEGESAAARAEGGGAPEGHAAAEQAAAEAEAESLEDAETGGAEEAPGASSAGTESPAGAADVGGETDQAFAAEPGDSAAESAASRTSAEEESSAANPAGEGPEERDSGEDATEDPEAEPGGDANDAGSVEKEEGSTPHSAIRWGKKDSGRE